jgi:hypothetical protein
VKLVNRIVSSILVFSLISGSAFALTAGDLAIVGFNSANPDSISIVVLTDLTAGTAFTLTDNAWQGNLGSPVFTTNEGVLVYTAPGAVSKGTVLFWQNGGAQNSAGFGAQSSNFAFNAAGDDVFIVDGTFTNTSINTATAGAMINGFSTLNYITPREHPPQAIPTCPAP